MSARGEDHRQGLLSRCGALDCEAWGDLFWPAVGRHDADGPPALEPTSSGAPLFDRAGALHTGHHPGRDTPQDDAGVDAPDGQGRRAMAAKALGTGRRWGLCVCVVRMDLPRPSGHLAWLRLAARLYTVPEPALPSKRGPKPKKGQRLPTLKSRVDEAKQHGQAVEVPWYGGRQKRLRVLTDSALWHTPGALPLAIRWVLVVDPADHVSPEAFFSTDVTQVLAEMIGWFVLRWNVEVTFEEGRRHLGRETQRQWSEQAIARTTPTLFGLFAFVCLRAYRLTEGRTLVPQSPRWAQKDEVPCSDVLARVTRTVWAACVKSPALAEPVV